jgi:hypothetical protein
LRRIPREARRDRGASSIRAPKLTIGILRSSVSLC